MLWGFQIAMRVYLALELPFRGIRAPKTITQVYKQLHGFKKKIRESLEYDPFICDVDQPQTDLVEALHDLEDANDPLVKYDGWIYHQLKEGGNKYKPEANRFKVCTSLTTATCYFI
jgi:hypothetical protein